MKEKAKKSMAKMQLRLVIVLMVSVIFAGCQQKTAASQPSAENVQAEQAQAEDPTEAAVVPLATNYIILSYPAEIQDDVTVTYENIEGGQKIVFTTDFTGEEIELFHFTISESGTEGYSIGVLEHEEAGSLVVCMNVQAYSDGNWKPEDFNKLNAMQERVNDIIIQFYEDPRFTPIN